MSLLGAVLSSRGGRSSSRRHNYSGIVSARRTGVADNASQLSCTSGAGIARPRAAPSSAARSPASSLKRESSRSQSPPKRSMTRHPPADDAHGTPLARPPSYDKSNVATNHRLRMSSSSHSRPRRQIHQSQLPSSQPISQEQLVTEVKDIYAGLMLAESKCIEVDLQNAKTDPATKLTNDQWQALIALHRTLLHDHHDFFLASQHPSASPALRRLASKYSMPARMWRHGMHNFLQLLRHRLPASLEHMLSFIYLAYSMMALLYQTVPAFEDTWIECLGDLGRYRMAIEDKDIRDREVWAAVSRHWYSKASDKAPTTGRLYYHLAILARPNALQQLYYYTKSLCVAVPFLSARESIMTLFDPIVPNHTQQQSRLGPTELVFVRTHGIMFSKRLQRKLEFSMAQFLNSLDSNIRPSTRQWLEPGYHIVIANNCAILGHGNDSNPIFSALKQPRSDETHDQPMQRGWGENPVSQELLDALKLANGTHNVVLRRFGDPNILPYLHVTLVFVYHLTFAPEAMAHLAPGFPWKLLALTLKTLLDSCQSYSRIESEKDYAMRSLLWADKYFPDDWFSTDKIDDDEKYFEVPGMIEDRKERATAVQKENMVLRFIVSLSRKNLQGRELPLFFTDSWAGTKSSLGRCASTTYSSSITFTRPVSPFHSTLVSRTLTASVATAATEPPPAGLELASRSRGRDHSPQGRED
ncbi:hypothetical protein B0T24DRAFT_651219 [Lasiosphaeria ovina]|uniref:DNA/RNA-binding domain-containing protein n=1 Tax=Lasiosphaeria ovina TaxID=92902 RepID=A0AAE0JYF1_9PEZI|nr:hypothetical protein B0T24DRAFT_651219 [Lasiosphaeria ovina]